TARLMSGQRQKNQPEQGVLACPAGNRSDAPKAAERGSETLVAKRKSESLAGSERLMEEVCELENCWQAYQRVKANQGSPGIDGMKVGELAGYLKQHWPYVRERLLCGIYHNRCDGWKSRSRTAGCESLASRRCWIE